MTIKVYGIVLSTPTLFVLATLQEKEADHELVFVDFMAGAHKKPEHLALHPFGLIPVLVDDSFTLFESRAMARYIAHKFEGQGAALYGYTPVDQALVEQWLEVEGQNFCPVTERIMQELYDSDHQPDEKVLQVQYEKLGKILDVYEARLTNSKYLAGEFFSLADLAHLPILNHLISYAQPEKITEGRPHVKAWWEDISSRLAWKKLAADVKQSYAQFLSSKQEGQ